MSFKDERNELIAMWSDIVRQLTEKGNKELLDVNKWITDVCTFFYYLLF